MESRIIIHTDQRRALLITQDLYVVRRFTEYYLSFRLYYIYQKLAADANSCGGSQIHMT